MAARTAGTTTSQTPTPYPTEHDERSGDAWLGRTRVVLTPLAAPSILGLFGFFTGTIMVGTNIAGWWGSGSSGLALWPFALTAGGIAQLLAGMWSYRARDGLATAMHGIWGAFWIAYGILQLLVATHVATAVPLGQPDPAFGMWFVALASITMMGAVASLAESLGLFAVLAALAGGSGIFAAGLFAGSLTADRVAGWFFVVSAAAAWYTASAMMLAGTSGRTLLPLGKWSAAANIPLREPVKPLEYAAGEPGVRAGQ
ncbi:MAG TPA: GPR1/FUN34/YaaH family transporter [Mycobacteriales bacterium]|nr:GPR1/FUN34/YaaH family transporter [Mycobacteriales bacterium]